MSDATGIHRRDFVRSAAAAAGAVSSLGILGARGQGGERKLRVALIGCGGRGSDALLNHLEAAGHAGVAVEVAAVADFFAERAAAVGGKHGLPAGRVFSGATGYRKLLEVPAEVVLLATPPVFRPAHFEAAIQAGRHVFAEKPVAVDPVGARRFLAAGEEATRKGLSVVAGTQRRYQADYLRTAAALRDGAIGRILGGTVMWCGGAAGVQPREAGEPDDRYLVRNWGNFAEMSGDHVVEQHVHNLDVANWYLGRPPESAVGFGGRARRQTGNQFDFFSVDLDYGDGVHLHSMCRQVNGAYGRVAEFFVGTEGTTSGNGGIRRRDNRSVTLPEIRGHENPYVQEHVALLDSIARGRPINDARAVAEATLAAIMCRISSYTGQLVRWADLTRNESSPHYSLALSPSAADFETGTVKAPPDDMIPAPGSA